MIVPVELLEERIAETRAHPLWPGDHKKHQSLWVFDRQRLKQRRVNQAEDGGVGPNPQRQRQRSYGGESGILQQHSHAETQILKHLVLQSSWLQTERVPKRPDASLQQVQFVSPIETVPFGQQQLAI